jgi:NADH dehydrogenase FAD-containing subunit
MKLNRRNFLKAAGATAALASAPTIAKAATATHHVVVIGGGFGGATVAKYIRMWSGYSVNVTLVDPNTSHTSCVMSNLVLNNRTLLSKLKLHYGYLSSKYGVNVVTGKAVDINNSSQQVTLESGDMLGYDRLVIATGIGFIDIPGYDPNITPHAWIAGSQTSMLTSQVNAMDVNSTFVMTIPKAPYRCPPGPYERACVVADTIVRKGFTSGDKARVVVLDANSDIQAEKHTFERAFSTLYRNIIEYIPNASVQAVDSAAKTIHTNIGDFSGDVVNVIPDQQATSLVMNAGLTDIYRRWAAVDPLTYESTEYGFQGVHVIGDSQGTRQPKSAHMANAQAKICADAIIRSLSGLPTDTQERMENVTTNSACYSPVSFDEASWLTANFYYDIESGSMKLRHIGEAENWSKKSYQEMHAWADNLFYDSFY